MHATLNAPTSATAPCALRRTDLDACTTLLEMRGELDLAAAPAFKACLGEWLEGRAAGDLVIELSGVTHLDSTGLAVLVAFRRRLPEGCHVTLAAPSAPVVKLLELTGLHNAFRVSATVEAARADLEATHRDATALPLTADAAVAVGLAATALLFADSPAAEAERWARILLPYGDAELVGELVGELGENDVAGAPHDAQAGGSAQERLERVVAHATGLTAARGCCGVRTGDLVGGAVAVYGPAFGAALQAQL